MKIKAIYHSHTHFSYSKEGVAKGKVWGTQEALKGKLALQQSLGLGHRPNVIPPEQADVHMEPRTVALGWHPVAGFAGKWFAEQTGLGKLITKEIHTCPDPTQHWGILVGDYVHELWMVRQNRVHLYSSFLAQ